MRHHGHRITIGSAPTPNAADMVSRKQLARSYTLVLLRKGLMPHDDEARNERLQQLTKLQMLGKLVLNGPGLMDHDIPGVSVYAAELEEARALADSKE